MAPWWRKLKLTLYEHSRKPLRSTTTRSFLEDPKKAAIGDNLTYQNHVDFDIFCFRWVFEIKPCHEWLHVINVSSAACFAVQVCWTTGFRLSDPTYSINKRDII